LKRILFAARKQGDHQGCGGGSPGMGEASAANRPGTTLRTRRLHCSAPSFSNGPRAGLASCIATIDLEWNPEGRAHPSQSLNRDACTKLSETFSKKFSKKSGFKVGVDRAEWLASARRMGEKNRCQNDLGSPVQFS
jgi:hypothetical protein